MLISGLQITVTHGGLSLRLEIARLSRIPLKAYSEHYMAGVRYFLGPMSSGELKELIADIKLGIRLSS
jgi:hypothetical protein